jgi:hypothetical protein
MNRLLFTSILLALVASFLSGCEDQSITGVPVDSQDSIPVVGPDGDTTYVPAPDTGAGPVGPVDPTTGEVITDTNMLALLAMWDGRLSYYDSTGNIRNRFLAAGLIPVSTNPFPQDTGHFWERYGSPDLWVFSLPGVGSAITIDNDLVILFPENLEFPGTFTGNPYIDSMKVVSRSIHLFQESFSQGTSTIQQRSPYIDQYPDLVPDFLFFVYGLGSSLDGALAFIERNNLGSAFSARNCNINFTSDGDGDDLHSVLDPSCSLPTEYHLGLDTYFTGLDSWKTPLIEQEQLREALPYILMAFGLSALEPVQGLHFTFNPLRWATTYIQGGLGRLHAPL